MTDATPASRRVSALTLAIAALLVPGAALAAVDFSGYWVLQSDPTDVPAAASTPEATLRVNELLAARGLNAPNGSPEYARTWCTPEGMPWQTTYWGPVDIRHGPLSVSMSYSVIADHRHIYIDGQPHPVEEEYDFTSVGHSIGSWQGDTLVATTMGLDGGVLVIPGGALRSENSRLTEHYQLVDQDTLRVTYTWTDPTTLLQPHTYTYEYARAPGTVWMLEPQCNPLRAMRAKGLPLPPDAPEF